MVGSRTGDWTVQYPVSELAARHGASVERETSDPDEAYAGYEPSRIGARRTGAASLGSDDWHVRTGQYGPPAVRLVVARCEVLYTGRLTARLPEAVRLLMFKADGSFLVHDDAGSYRPLNWIRSAFRLRRTRAHALVAS